MLSPKVGTHGGTCCRDMSRGRISCAVHTNGHVAGIGFLKGFGELKWRFLISLFFWSVAGTCSWTVHTRRPCVSRYFVPATCPLNSNWSEFRGNVARTKFRPRRKIFHENWAFTRWDLSLQNDPARCPLVCADLNPFTPKFKKWILPTFSKTNVCMR